MNKLPGITRQDEEEKLKHTIAITEQKLENTRQNVASLANQLHEMLEIYDESDKEGLALWFNTDSRFKQVNQDLKRAERARKKPYFGRIDFLDKQNGKQEVYYIGKSVVAENPAEPEVIDWRAPIASVYYDYSLGDLTYSVKGEGKFEINLSRKRTYEIDQDQLKDYYDSDVVANDDLLTKYLAKSKRSILGEIIATIQKEQNDVIRKKPQHNVIIQGAAGSGKTTVAMHRISYILYNYELEFDPKDFYIIGSNQVLLDYITGVLPDLDVYGVTQMTMEQLFIRLLYEDWDERYTIRQVQRGITPKIKGTLAFFQQLEKFCDEYEWNLIPRDDVCIEKNGVLLLAKEEIEKLIRQNKSLSRLQKIEKLTEHLMARLENEINGKYYSYGYEEKKNLIHYYETYFGKKEWKGSVFDVYDEFLLSQNEKGIQVNPPGDCLDVYDLAALAYLYKRFKETEVIREAGHVVIDEAQDFGMMAYSCLKYCLSKCTYTIMGDVSQNISIDYGLNDWKELRELILPGEFDYFGLLRKSYRNTVEISEFATNILYHGSFQIYPIEPIIRHGKEVLQIACKSFEDEIQKAAKIIKQWLEQGQETIAVVCRDEQEAARVSKGLEQKVTLLQSDKSHMEFGQGVMVLSLEYTKGLEFDSVLLWDASAENYPVTDGYVKRLYVAATRALHELVVLYTGTLTGLIADPVDKTKVKNAVIVSSNATRKPMPEEQEKTKTQIYKDQAKEAEKEMALRHQIGPKRITPQYQEQPKAAGVRIKSIKVDLPKKEEKNETPREKSEFGEMPDTQTLRSVGHTKINCSVRFFMKSKTHCDMISNYGTLRITPLTQEVIRVCFARGQCSQFPKPLKEFEKTDIHFQSRETRTAIEILTGKILVRIEKATGAVGFFTLNGKQMLVEKAKEPRQVEQDRNYIYFDFHKNEELIARGEADSGFLKLPSCARYISFGSNTDRTPAIASENGYELMFPPKQKVLSCTIPMYGPYICVEGASIIDYYFRIRR